MITVFYGKDTVSVRKAAHVEIGKKNKNNQEVLRIDANSYMPSMVMDAAGGSSLFGGSQIVLIDSPAEDSALHEELLKHIEDLQSSPNHFVVIEGQLKAPEKKKYQKWGEVHEVAPETVEAKQNPFALTDALLSKDKKKLWLLLQEFKNTPGEEIIGVLFWQIKMLRLVEKTNSPTEAGQKPFVYNKAKSSLAKFKEGEVDILSRELVSIYHKAHQGEGDMKHMLEEWVLKL